MSNDKVKNPPALYDLSRQYIQAYTDFLMPLQRFQRLSEDEQNLYARFHVERPESTFAGSAAYFGSPSDPSNPRTQYAIAHRRLTDIHSWFTAPLSRFAEALQNLLSTYLVQGDQQVRFESMCHECYKDHPREIQSNNAAFEEYLYPYKRGDPGSLEDDWLYAVEDFDDLDRELSEALREAQDEEGLFNLGDKATENYDSRKEEGEYFWGLIQHRSILAVKSATSGLGLLSARLGKNTPRFVTKAVEYGQTVIRAVGIRQEAAETISSTVVSANAVAEGVVTRGNALVSLLNSKGFEDGIARVMEVIGKKSLDKAIVDKFVDITSDKAITKEAVSLLMENPATRDNAKLAELLGRADMKDALSEVGVEHIFHGIPRLRFTPQAGRKIAEFAKELQGAAQDVLGEGVSLTEEMGVALEESVSLLQSDNRELFAEGLGRLMDAGLERSLVEGLSTKEQVIQSLENAGGEENAIASVIRQGSMDEATEMANLLIISSKTSREMNTMLEVSGETLGTGAGADLVEMIEISTKKALTQSALKGIINSNRGQEIFNSTETFTIDGTEKTVAEWAELWLDAVRRIDDPKIELEFLEDVQQVLDGGETSLDSLIINESWANDPQFIRNYINRPADLTEELIGRRILETEGSEEATTGMYTVLEAARTVARGNLAIQESFSTRALSGIRFVRAAGGDQTSRWVMEVITESIIARNGVARGIFTLLDRLATRIIEKGVERATVAASMVLSRVASFIQGNIISALILAVFTGVIALGELAYYNVFLKNNIVPPPSNVIALDGETVREYEKDAKGAALYYGMRIISIDFTYMGADDYTIYLNDRRKVDRYLFIVIDPSVGESPFFLNTQEIEGKLINMATVEVGKGEDPGPLTTVIKYEDPVDNIPNDAERVRKGAEWEDNSGPYGGWKPFELAGQFDPSKWMIPGSSIPRNWLQEYSNKFANLFRGAEKIDLDTSMWWVCPFGPEKDKYYCYYSGMDYTRPVGASGTFGRMMANKPLGVGDIALLGFLGYNPGWGTRTVWQAGGGTPTYQVYSPFWHYWIEFQWDYDPISDEANFMKDPSKVEVHHWEKAENIPEYLIPGMHEVQRRFPPDPEEGKKDEEIVKAADKEDEEKEEKKEKEKEKPVEEEKEEEEEEPMPQPKPEPKKKDKWEKLEEEQEKWIGEERYDFTYHSYYATKYYWLEHNAAHAPKYVRDDVLFGTEFNSSRIYMEAFEDGFIKKRDWIEYKQYTKQHGALKMDPPEGWIPKNEMGLNTFELRKWDNMYESEYSRPIDDWPIESEEEEEEIIDTTEEEEDNISEIESEEYSTGDEDVVSEEFWDDEEETKEETEEKETEKEKEEDTDTGKEEEEKEKGDNDLSGKDPPWIDKDKVDMGKPLPAYYYQQAETVATETELPPVLKRAQESYYAANDSAIQGKTDKAEIELASEGVPASFQPPIIRL